MKRSPFKKHHSSLRPRKVWKVAYHSLSTRRGLIAELDKVTSWIVRARDGVCVLCGTTEDLTASHFYSRRWLHVRFDLRNVCCMCMFCNARHNETVWPYLNWLLDTYDEETLHTLHELRMSTRKITDDELRRLLESHRRVLKGFTNPPTEVARVC